MNSGDTYGVLVSLAYVALLAVIYPIVVGVLKNKLSDVKGFIFTYLLAIYLPIYSYIVEYLEIQSLPLAIATHALSIYYGVVKPKHWRYAGLAPLIPISIILIPIIVRVS